MRRTRVYVAGAYSADNIITIQENMRLGLRLATEVLKAGYAPFTPWLDFQFGLLDAVLYEEYLAYSMAWMEAAEVVLVQPVRLKESRGSQKEIARARALSIPIVHSVKELIEKFPVV